MNQKRYNKYGKLGLIYQFHLLYLKKHKSTSEQFYVFLLENKMGKGYIRATNSIDEIVKCLTHIHTEWAEKSNILLQFYTDGLINLNLKNIKLKKYLNLEIQIEIINKFIITFSTEETTKKIYNKLKKYILNKNVSDQYNQ